MLFLILSLFIQISFLKILIFVVFYTDFVSDHSGRTVYYAVSVVS